jgi:hypothetical protein
MRKNQKYSKEEMYLAMELWQESGLSQGKFCSRENLSVKTFSYWYKKYKKEKGFLLKKTKKLPILLFLLKFPVIKPQLLETKVMAA